MKPRSWKVIEDDGQIKLYTSPTGRCCYICHYFTDWEEYSRSTAFCYKLNLNLAGIPDFDEDRYVCKHWEELH